MELSIVVPVYNEVDNIDLFASEVIEALEELETNFEVIFCLDPSDDGTESKIAKLNQSDSRFKLIRFSRRFGQPAAIMAGLNFSIGEAVVVMDVDLQDPPTLLPELIQKWKLGHKLVLAERIARSGEPYSKRMISNLGYRFLNRFSEVPIPRNTGDFRLMDREIVNTLLTYKETNTFLRGLIAQVGYEAVVVTFNRPTRVQGHTKYNKWFGSLKIGFDGIVGYSKILLKISAIFGVLISTTSILAAFGIIIARLNGVNLPLGFSSLVVLIALLGGTILISLGILGLYIGRILDEVKDRPKYIVEYSLGIERLK